MGIEITNQINEQECGVCVLTTLHNYYYPHSPLEKQDVLQLSHIQNDGLSIFDFEALSHQIDLGTETYQLTWDEFLQLKLTKYFVLLVTSSNGGNHYIIAKKQKHQIEIYDSATCSVKKIKYEELKSSFLGILILVNKNKTIDKTKEIYSHKSLLLINVKQIIISIILYSFVFIFSVIITSFLNWLIDLVITKQSVSNLITIAFIFALVYILNDLTNYIISLYSSTYIKNNLIFLTSKILSSLSYKSPSFFNKVDKVWIYKIDECVYHISNYCLSEINKFITNIIFIIVCICIVGIINPWLLIFCSVYLIIEMIFFFLSYSKKKELFTRLLKNENKNTLNYKSLISNLESEFWISKRLSIINKIKNNYSNLYKNFSDVNIFRANTSLFKSILKSIFEILLFSVISYLSIKSTTLTIGRITFLVGAFNLLKTASTGIFEFLLYRIEFITYWQIYQDMLKVDNSFNNECALEFSEVNNIFINYYGKDIVLHISKKENTIPSNFIEILKSSDSIKIDEQVYKTNDVRLAQTLIVLDEYSLCNKETLIENLNNNPTLISKYIRYFNLDVNSDKVSCYQSLIINLINLSQEKNKIIIMDSIHELFKEKDNAVIKDLINKIMKENFVFITRKES